MRLHKWNGHAIAGNRNRCKKATNRQPQQMHKGHKQETEFSLKATNRQHQHLLKCTNRQHHLRWSQTRAKQQQQPDQSQATAAARSEPSNSSSQTRAKQQQQPDQSQATAIALPCLAPAAAHLEAEFMDVIGTKCLRVFLLAIHTHLY